ncbi:MAG: hypothetical protein ABI442_21360 [Gemmatimonadaceae bacterium]
MLDSIVGMLDHVGSAVFWTCAVLLVVTDVAAAAVVIQRQSRELVNRWTGRILAANVLLLSTGLGVPAATYVVKTAVLAVAPSVQSAVTENGVTITGPAK